MRKIILLFVLFLAANCIAQNKQILYNFTSVPQSLMTNPGADVKYNGYFGIPLLSGISANVGSSGFSAYDLFANDGVDFNVKLRKVLFASTRKDKAAINQQLEVFSGGFKVGDWHDKAYVSFGMYQELDFFSYMPKDLAVLALDGNRDYLGKVFNLGDLNVKAEMLSVFHFGYHKNINENLIVGARAKVYSSFFNATSTNNSGYIYTIASDKGVYEQVISSNLALKTAGISKYFEEDYSGSIASDMKKKAFLGGDLGLGLDVGLSYYPKKNIQFTASLIDVGFVRHTKDVETFTYKGYYKYEGINPNFSNGNSGGDVYQEFKDAIPLDSLYGGYTTWRPAKLNTSIQYSFDDSRNEDCNCDGADSGYRNAVGAQLFVMSTPRTPFIAFTTYYRRRVLNSLQMKATYTVDAYSYKNIGLGLSTQLGKLNLYLLADNLLEYHDLAKANSLSFQFGLNVILPDSDQLN